MVLQWVFLNRQFDHLQALGFINYFQFSLGWTIVNFWCTSYVLSYRRKNVKCDVYLITVPLFHCFILWISHPFVELARSWVNEVKSLSCWCILICWALKWPCVLVDALTCWCCCVDVLACWCVDVLMCGCADTLMCWCVDVWWLCWCCWCVDVLIIMLTCWWLCWCVDLIARGKPIWKVICQSMQMFRLLGFKTWEAGLSEYFQFWFVRVLITSVLSSKTPRTLQRRFVPDSLMILR
jgi:hypothetical protein